MCVSYYVVVTGEIAAWIVLEFLFDDETILQKISGRCSEGRGWTHCGRGYICIYTHIYIYIFVHVLHICIILCSCEWIAAWIVFWFSFYKHCWLKKKRPMFRRVRLDVLREGLNDLCFRHLILNATESISCLFGISCVCMHIVYTL